MSKQFTPEEAEAELARVRKILDDRGVAYERETFSRDDVGAAGAALLLAEIRKHEQTLSTYADGAADRDRFLMGKIEGMKIAFRLVFGRAP